jgi:hypothetical protein
VFELVVNTLKEAEKKKLITPDAIFNSAATPDVLAKYIPPRTLTDCIYEGLERKGLASSEEDNADMRLTSDSDSWELDPESK